LLPAVDGLLREGEAATSNSWFEFLKLFALSLDHAVAFVTAKTLAL
jgi:hypothetical protein